MADALFDPGVTALTQQLSNYLPLANQPRVEIIPSDEANNNRTPELPSNQDHKTKFS